MSPTENVQSGVSYLLPVKPPSEWLNQCLESYVNDNFNARELLLIFNGGTSTDQEIQLAKGILNGLDYRILKIDDEGIAKALNAGLALSKYKYVARIDSDDIIIRGRTLRQFEFLEKEQHKRVGVVGGQVNIIDPYGNEKKSHWYPTHPNLVAINFFVRTPIAHPAAMIRREILIDLGGYKSNIFAEDLHLWSNILKNWDISNLSESVIEYRKHNLQETNVHGAEILKESIRIRQDLLSRIAMDDQKQPILNLRVIRFLVKHMRDNFSSIATFELNLHKYRISRKLCELFIKPNSTIFIYGAIRILISVCNKINRARAGFIN